jgi:hypothetical protein
VRLLWTHNLATPLHGLSLARERETVFVCDGRNDLFLFDRAGKLQAQRPAPWPVAVAGCSENGSAFVVGGAQTPMICWLAPDLAPLWQRPLSRPATALAVEPLGGRIAVADAGGSLYVIDARGKTVWQATTPRALHHLAFVPEKPILAGASDFGLVVCFGSTGECLWRDGLVAHIGSLASNGDGSCLLFACFTDGLVCFNAEAPKQERIPLDAPCHLAVPSYAGDILLTADRQNRLCLRDRTGDLRNQITVEAPAAAIALGALADYAVAGLVNGALVRFDDKPA